MSRTRRPVPTDAPAEPTAATPTRTRKPRRPAVEREHEHVTNGGVERTDQNETATAAAAKTAKPVSKREQNRVAKLRDEARALRVGSGPDASDQWSVAELKKKFGADFDVEWLDGIDAPRSNGANGKPKAAKPKSDQPKGKKLPITNDAVRMIREKFGKVSAEKLVAEVEAMCGATASVEQIDKIGKREIRDDVPDVPRGAKSTAKPAAKPVLDPTDASGADGANGGTDRKPRRKSGNSTRPANAKPASAPKPRRSTARTTSKYAAAAK